MQIHGLRYGTQAAWQVNASGWNPISDTTVTLLGNATAYGGSEGIQQLKDDMSLPAAWPQWGRTRSASASTEPMAG